MVKCCTCGSMCDENSQSYQLSGRCFRCDTSELPALHLVHQCAWCTVVLAPTPYNQGKKIPLRPQASHGVCKPCSAKLIAESRKRKQQRLVPTPIRMRKVVQKFFAPILFMLSSFKL